MQLHQLKRKTKNRKPAKVGRGGRRGKTSGRGTKGQKARSGRKLRPELRDIIKRLPKRRGYGKNRNLGLKVKNAVFNLTLLDKVFKANESVTPQSLVEKKMLRTTSGLYPSVKILGTGEVTKALSFANCLVSKSAQEKIEKAGGKIA